MTPQGRLLKSVPEIVVAGHLSFGGGMRNDTSRASPFGASGFIGSAPVAKNELGGTGARSAVAVRSMTSLPASFPEFGSVGSSGSSVEPVTPMIIAPAG